MSKVKKRVKTTSKYLLAQVAHRSVTDSCNGPVLGLHTCKTDPYQVWYSSVSQEICLDFVCFTYFGKSMFYKLGTDLFYLCKTEFWFRTVLHTCSRSDFSLFSLTLIWLCIPGLSQVCIHPVKINAVLSLYYKSVTGLFYPFSRNCVTFFFTE